MNRQYKFDFSNMTVSDLLDLNVFLEGYNRSCGEKRAVNLRGIMVGMSRYADIDLNHLPADQIKDFWTEGLEAFREYLLDPKPGAVWDDVWTNDNEQT